MVFIVVVWGSLSSLLLLSFSVCVSVSLSEVYKSKGWTCVESSHTYRNDNDLHPSSLDWERTTQINKKREGCEFNLIRRILCPSVTVEVLRCQQSRRRVLSWFRSYTGDPGVVVRGVTGRTVGKICFWMVGNHSYCIIKSGNGYVLQKRILQESI